MFLREKFCWKLWNKICVKQSAHFNQLFALVDTVRDNLGESLGKVSHFHDLCWPCYQECPAWIMVMSETVYSLAPRSFVYCFHHDWTGWLVHEHVNILHSDIGEPWWMGRVIDLLVHYSTWSYEILNSTLYRKYTLLKYSIYILSSQKLSWLLWHVL